MKVFRLGVTWSDKYFRKAMMGVVWEGEMIAPARIQLRKIEKVAVVI